MNCRRVDITALLFWQCRSEESRHHRPKWIDVVHDRDLPQHDPADKVHRPDALGENRRRSGRAGRQTFGKFLIVEPHAYGKGRNSVTQPATVTACAQG
jgi:hypothetical protein